MNEHNAKATQKLSTESYKGVRDFFPADMAVEKHIFDIWRSVSEKYGYEEYNASVLEPADLYRAKSGEEIINQQTYTFVDRGEREVTLRPEMTPTVARMVAARKRELAYPLRWYSIPNLFRYENPQRGRLREFWQYNMDIFGVSSLAAEIECIQIAYDITRRLGLTDTDFEIRIHNRKVMNYIGRDIFGLDEVKANTLLKCIDRKNKVSKEAFSTAITEVLGDEKKSAQLLTILNSQNFEEFTSNLPQTTEEHEGISEIKAVLAGLEAIGITNAVFDQTLTRGSDYYTGIVFEIFDKNPENRRSVAGGGRYDDLLDLFGGDKVPAVGFGMGDVIANDLMNTYGSLPAPSAPADIMIIVVGEQNATYALAIAKQLRENTKMLAGIPTSRISVDISGRKIGDQIKAADKRGIPHIIVIGDEETKSGALKIKTLASGVEAPLSL
jgi:histidyl-tRNA synthetase